MNCVGGGGGMAPNLLYPASACFFSGFCLQSDNFSSAMNETASTTRYFTSYSGVRLPLNLVGELSADDMRNRNTFFRGHFATDGRLLCCEKVVYGEIEVCHHYRYHADGRIAQAVIDDGGDEAETIDFPA